MCRAIQEIAMTVSNNSYIFTNITRIEDREPRYFVQDNEGNTVASGLASDLEKVGISPQVESPEAIPEAGR